MKRGGKKGYPGITLRDNNNVVYERLEDLLMQAGYKETRIFTPEHKSKIASHGSSSTSTFGPYSESSGKLDSDVRQDATTASSQTEIRKTAFSALQDRQISVAMSKKLFGFSAYLIPKRHLQQGTRNYIHCRSLYTTAIRSESDGHFSCLNFSNSCWSSGDGEKYHLSNAI